VGERRIVSPAQSVGGYDPDEATLAVSIGDLVIPDEGLDATLEVLQHAAYPSPSDGAGSITHGVPVRLVDPCGLTR
jgi:hypothetical protein